MWNGARLHLILVHAPIAATAFAMLFLLLAELTRWRFLHRGGWMLLVIGALGATGAYLTGESAEDVLGAAATENEAAFQDAPRRVHDHEERALLAFRIAVVAGIVGAGMLLAEMRSGAARADAATPGAPARDWRTPRAVRVAVLVLAAVTVGFMVSAASLGGEIRHTEITAREKPPAPR